MEFVELYEGKEWVADVTETLELNIMPTGKMATIHQSIGDRHTTIILSSKEEIEQLVAALQEGLKRYK